MNVFNVETLTAAMALILFTRIVHVGIAGQASAWQWHLIAIQVMALTGVSVAPQWVAVFTSELPVLDVVNGFVLGLAVLNSVLMISTWHIRTITRKHTC